jgi:hypothetical protein
MPDGTKIKMADPSAGITEWILPYSDLTTAEANILEQFFAAAEGRLNGFTFLDPSANLFASSDQLDAAVWERDPWLSVTGGLGDPRGGHSSWTLSNSGAGPQTLAQTLAIPAGYVCCFSVYVLAPQGTPLTLIAGSQRAEKRAAGLWSRISFTVTTDIPRFGIELPAETSVQVFGMQLEPQLCPSEYHSSLRSGVYEDARLGNDILKITATGYNRYSCTINIVHANHL